MTSGGEIHISSPAWNTESAHKFFLLGFPIVSRQVPVQYYELHRDRFLPHLNPLQISHIVVTASRTGNIIKWRGLIYDSESHRHVFNAC